MKSTYEMLTPAPTNASPNTQVVQAPDLARAFDQIRLLYGDDALIVETRRVRRDEGDWVEVVVADPDAPAESVPVDAPATQPARDRLNELLSRLEALSVAVGALEHEPDPYPLFDELSRAGCSPRLLRELARDFETISQRGSRSTTAARRHLAQVLRGNRPEARRELTGEHWFVGRAGSGKTTLCLTLAGALREAGQRPVVISLSPRHPGELRRVESAAQAMDVAAASAYDEDDLREVRRHFAGRDVILVDTPCAVSQRAAAGPPDGATLHLVTPLAEDPSQLRDNLRRTALQPHHLAFTQSDLCRQAGRAVELAAAAGVPVSFVLGRGEGGLEVRRPTTAELLEWVLPIPAAEATEA